MVEQAQEEAALRDIADYRQEWHEQRATIIGATDAPKILGLSKYGTALSVYNDKTDPDTSDRQMSLPAWLGLKMQATVGELYTQATGIRLRASEKMWRMPGYDFIGCHLDYRAWGKPTLLVECKTRAYMAGWGEVDEEGHGKIPVEVWVQVQHEMMVTGADECHVAVLFGHHTFRIYVIPKDAEFQKQLLQKLIDFREQNWLAGVPPLPTGNPVDSEIVKEANPEHDDEIIPATPEQAAIVEDYRRADINVKQAQVRQEELKNRIRDLIGTHAGISGPFGMVTWKRTKDSSETEWRQVANSYRSLINEMAPFVEVAAARSDSLRTPAEIAATDLDAIESIYTSVKPGTRRFNFQFSEE